MVVDISRPTQEASGGLHDYARELITTGQCFCCGADMQPVIGNGGVSAKVCPQCGAEVEMME